MRARLLAIDGGTSIDLVKDLTLIGRDEDCDVRFEQKSISKHHCVIAKTDGLLLVRDLGSTNGTRVNGQRVRRAALLPNDMLSVANVKYRVLFGIDLEPEPLPDEKPNDLPEIPLQRNLHPDVYPEAKTPPG